MDNQPQQQTTNPMHLMEDSEVLSRMVLARDEGNDHQFVEYRDEVIYRMKLGHIEQWTAPQRIERKS